MRDCLSAEGERNCFCAMERCEKEGVRLVDYCCCLYDGLIFLRAKKVVSFILSGGMVGWHSTWHLPSGKSERGKPRYLFLPCHTLIRPLSKRINRGGKEYCVRNKRKPIVPFPSFASSLPSKRGPRGE